MDNQKTLKYGDYTLKHYLCVLDVVTPQIVKLQFLSNPLFSEMGLFTLHNKCFRCFLDNLISHNFNLKPFWGFFQSFNIPFKKNLKLKPFYLLRKNVFIHWGKKS